MKTLRNKLVPYSSLLLLLFPIVTYAQNAGQLSTAKSLVKSIGTLVSNAIPIAAALALLGFFFGLAKYIFQAGDEDAQEQGKQIMIWGVIALFLIAAIGGIIEALQSALGLNQNAGVNPSNFKDNIPSN